MTLESLLPAYKFCGDNGLKDEKEKIRELLNVYLDLAVKEHKTALDRLTPVAIGLSDAKEETKE